jgi:hypothetical protein
MPRAKANPEPAVEEYTARSGLVFRLEAFKSGGYNIWLGDKLVAVGPTQINAYFGAPRYPSNRLQDEALTYARVRAEGLRADAL